uniref:Glycoprotein hormone beta-5 n=1 Tax=Latimeria chalumnae TaxID=7897 RepID=H3AFX8_LATCH
SLLLKMQLPPCCLPLLFCLLLSLVCPLLSSITLHSFIGCAVREFTFIARKPGCKGLRVKTDACWGRCETWEKPVLDPPYVDSYHRLCTYNRTRYVTIKLPDCQPSVSPFFTYPEALSCDCSVCSTDNTECET